MRMKLKEVVNRGFGAREECPAMRKLCGNKDDFLLCFWMTIERRFCRFVNGFSYGFCMISLQELLYGFVFSRELDEEELELSGGFFCVIFYVFFFCRWLPLLSRSSRFVIFCKRNGLRQ